MSEQTQNEKGYLHTRSKSFAKIPIELLHDKTVTDGAKLLYAHMHWRYGSNCKNFEGQQSMAAFFGISRKTVENRVDELVQHDWVITIERRTKRGRRPNFYHIFEVRQDCITWREEHHLAKPEPRKKQGKIVVRKTRQKVGGRPSHKHPKETQVSISQRKLEYAASSIQTQENQTQSNLSSNEDKLAGTATQLPAVPSNPKERAMLNTLQREGVTCAHNLEERQIEHALVEKGLAQPVGVIRGVTLPAAQPLTESKTLADPAIPVLQASLSLLVEESTPPLPVNLPTLTGEAIRELESTNAPYPPPPLPPAALPEVPSGYEAIYSSMGVQHYLVKGRKKTLCNERIRSTFPVSYSHIPSVRISSQCSDCARLAAAAPKAGKAVRAKKPALRQPDKAIKDALALLMHGGNGHLTAANWSAIVKLWNQLECPPLDKIQKMQRWWAQDWRGKKGEFPTYGTVIGEWPTAMHWQNGTPANGTNSQEYGIGNPSVGLDRGFHSGKKDGAA